MLAVLLAFAAGARGEDARVDRIDLVESGFYDADSVTVAGSVLSPGAAAGKTLDLRDIHFSPRRPANGARLGTGFGIRFRSLGEPAGARVVLRSVWKIPEPGIYNPNNRNTYPVADFTALVGKLQMRGYQFDEPWEVVPGSWTLEIWQGDRKFFGEELYDSIVMIASNGRSAFTIAAASRPR